MGNMLLRCLGHWPGNQLRTSAADGAAPCAQHRPASRSDGYATLDTCRAVCR